LDCLYKAILVQGHMINRYFDGSKSPGVSKPTGRSSGGSFESSHFGAQCSCHFLSHSLFFSHFWSKLRNPELGEKPPKDEKEAPGGVRGGCREAAKGHIFLRFSPEIRFLHENICTRETSCQVPDHMCINFRCKSDGRSPKLYFW